MPRPRENIKAANFSPWCSLTLLHMERLGMTNADLAKIMRGSEFLVHSALTGRTKPPLDKVADIAGAIGLKGSERDSYVLEAHLAHSTKEVRDYIAALRKANKELQVAVAVNRLKDE